MVSKEKIRLVFSSYHLLLFLLVHVLLSSGCENDTTAIDRVASQNHNAVEEIRDFETIYSDSGQMKVKVNAPHLIKSIKPSPITNLPKGLKISFFDQNKKVISKLTANKAIHYEDQYKWIASNHVEVINDKGEKLNTEKLVWDTRKELLFSDEFVKIATPKEIIMGHGFEANQDFTHYKIFNVTGRIAVKE